MTHIGVTGSSGFIGQKLVRHLAKREDVIVAAYTRSKERHWDDLKNVIQRPAEDTSWHTEKLDVLIDLAWNGSAGPGRGNVEDQLFNILRSRTHARNIHSKGGRYVGIGTISELLAPEDKPVYELNDPEFYGYMKSEARELTKRSAVEYGSDHVWVHLGNVFDYEDQSHRFVNIMSSKIAEGETIHLSGANSVLDLIGLEQAVRGIEAAALNGESFNSYVVGSGSPDYVESYVVRMIEVFRRLGLETSAEVVNDDDSDLGSFEPYSIEPLRALGYEPDFDFEKLYSPIAQLHHARTH